MSALEDQLHADIKKIIKRKGHDFPYELIISPDILQMPDGSLVDIQINAGNPPQIVVPLSFLVVVGMKEDKIKYRDRLERALEKLPRMTRSLSNMIPSNMAIVLCSDLKKWRKTKAERDEYTIADRWFEVSYTVHVKETLTGIEMTLNGGNPSELTRQAKERLSRIILNDEATKDFRRLVQQLGEKIDVVSPPKSIAIISKGEGTEERSQY